MKVTNIKYIDGTYIVNISPNWIERLFGLKDKITMLRGTLKQYTYSGQSVFRYQDGTETPNGCHIAQAIDKFNRKWS